VALLAAAVTVAWVVSGAVARRAQAARLPPVPDLSHVSTPVRAQIEEMAAAARARPGAAALGALGRAYLGSELIEPAYRAFSAAEAIDASDWQWPWYRALLHEARGDTGGVATALQTVLAANPDLPLGWLKLGDAQLKRGEIDAADTAYRRALGSQTPSPLSQPGSRTPPVGAYAGLGLARVALERRDRVGARRQLQQTLAAEPSFGPAWRLLADVERTDGRAAEAQRALRRASAARAYVPPADPLVDAVLRESRDSAVLLKHAALAARAGDRPWREFLARRAYEFHPQDPDVLMEMATMLQASGRPEEALAFLQRHARIVPGDHHTLTQMGKCLSDLGRHREAEQVLRRVRVADAAAAFNLGLALDSQGRWEEARAQYERALSIDRFHVRACNNLGAGLARRGELPRALALLGRALEVAPGDAEVHSNLGNVLQQAGRVPEAIAAYETAIDLDPAYADAYSNLGVALARVGRVEDARRRFEDALRHAPGHTDARRNLDRLAALPR
jgi:tetratricopeptide (TPR) repeat protein